MIRLPGPIRRYLSCAILFLHTAYCWISGMPFFSSNLPQYSGKYAVGTIDIEVPRPRRKICDAVFHDTGQPAFELETVLVSLFYPAVRNAASRLPPHPWVSKPISMQAEGYARFARMNNAVTNGVFGSALWMLAGGTTIPAHVDVPLHGTVKTYHDDAAEQPTDDSGLPRFPVMVFSHGMASGRTSYSQYCGELASRGYVVAAIEHRDGSGPGTTIMTENGSRPLFHINEAQLDPRPETEQFKAMQLAMRQAEVEETVAVLREIHNGSGRVIYEANARAEGRDLAEWKGRLMMERMVIGGHSYGATLALQTLKDAPSAPLPFVGAIILDPGKHSGPLNDAIDVPIVVVHSQSWSARHTIFHGRPHFEVVRDLVRKIVDEKKTSAWFVTAKGTTHPSVTDAPLIEPVLLSWTTGSTINARDGVLQYVKITQQLMRFLADGHRQSILNEDVTHREYDDPHARGYDRKVAKYFQIHVAPSAACPVSGYCGLDDADGDG
jgi:platelet-activating factor acetylhydrolase